MLMATEMARDAHVFLGLDKQSDIVIIAVWLGKVLIMSKRSVIAFNLNSMTTQMEIALKIIVLLIFDGFSLSKHAAANKILVTFVKCVILIAKALIR